MQPASGNGVQSTAGEMPPGESHDTGGPDLGDGRTSGDSARPRVQRSRGGMAPTQRHPRPSRSNRPDEGTERGFASAALRAIATPSLASESDAKRWPQLVATLNATKDVNGDDCEPGGLSLTIRAGRVSWSLRSPAYNVRVSGWSDTLEGLLDSVEAILTSAEPACVELKKHVSKRFREKQKKA